MGQALQGQSLEVLGNEGDWLKVRKSGQVYWVADWLVELSSVSPVPDGNASSHIAEVTGDDVNIRGGPGTWFNVVGRVVKGGNKYNLLDKSGDWYKISIGGMSGWVYGQYVKVVTSQPATQPGFPLSRIILYQLADLSARRNRSPKPAMETT